MKEGKRWKQGERSEKKGVGRVKKMGIEVKGVGVIKVWKEIMEKLPLFKKANGGIQRWKF